jgi:hypothetical protein
MIQGILSYQFVLIPGDGGILEPEFKPVRLVFNNKDFDQNEYSGLIDTIDIFGIFYQHTTGISSTSGELSNFYMGRLKNTPYQVLSFFRQDHAENQFLTISLFNLDDDIEIFEELIKQTGEKLESLFFELMRRKALETIEKIESELKFCIFQVNRLSELDKLQKVALIFQSEERIKILELLRERPYSKKELKLILETIRPNPNIDILIQPFLELNLIRRDWIKGETARKKALDLKFQGEYLFLTKDIVLARFPNKDLMDRIKDAKPELYAEYEQKLAKYFADYNVLDQSNESLKELASALLNPDCFDFYTLMANNYYPLDKLPKIFSDFVDSEFIVNTMEGLDVITKVKDKDNKLWVLLFTDIKPLIIFPEYLLLKIKDSYLSEKRENKITHEIAKKALDLLEVTYQEKVKF